MYTYYKLYKNMNILYENMFILLVIEKNKINVTIHTTKRNMTF